MSSTEPAPYVGDLATEKRRAEALAQAANAPWGEALAKAEAVTERLDQRLDTLAAKVGPLVRPLPPGEDRPVPMLQEVPPQEPSPAVRSMRGLTDRLAAIDLRVCMLIETLDT